LALRFDKFYPSIREKFQEMGNGILGGTKWRGLPRTVIGDTKSPVLSAADTGRRQAGYALMRVAPQVIPAPNATQSTRPPGVMRPVRTPSSQSSGMVAAVVLPYFWML